MAIFKLKLQPGFATASLTMDVYGSADAFVSTHAATVAQENGTWVATATIDASVPGMADQQITIYVRDLDDDSLLVVDSYSIDETGAILPTQSNAGFDQKLDNLATGQTAIINQDNSNTTIITDLLGTPVNADMSTDIAEVNQGVSAIDVSNIPKVGGGQYYMTITDTTQGAAKAGITLTAI